MGGFFMVIPLMAVHFVENLGWAAGTIGIILALRQFFQQSVTAFFGALCDRIGPKPLLLGGMALRVVSFVLLGLSETFWPVLISSLMVALSGSMFESPRAAALSALAPQAERQRVFSKVGVAGGIGTAVGTQIGALLITQDFAYVCFAGAAAFVCVFVVLLLMLPHFGINLVTVETGSAFRTIMRDKVFVFYLVLLTGHWFAWTQFGLTVTLAATDISGNEGAVAWLYLAQTIITVLFGYALPRFMERWWTSLQLLIYGTAVMGTGLLLVGASPNIGFLLVAAAIFSLGSVLARPGQETTTANLADPRAPGAYFGVASWSLAIGGGLGNYLGGTVYDVGRAGHPMLPWMIFAAIAFSCAIGMWIMRGPFGAVRNVQQQPVKATVDETD
jgi:DHA1 family multidrug resistance protein-like MFS transporter